MVTLNCLLHIAIVFHVNIRIVKSIIVVCVSKIWWKLTSEKPCHIRIISFVEIVITYLLFVMLIMMVTTAGVQ